MLLNSCSCWLRSACCAGPARGTASNAIATSALPSTTLTLCRARMPVTRCSPRGGKPGIVLLSERLADASSLRVPPPLDVAQGSHQRTRLAADLVGLLHQRDEALGQCLAEFHTPLIERVVAPDHALHEHLVLVQRNDPTERR